jgi:hypothetical protein
MTIKYLHKQKAARRVTLWMVVPAILLQLGANALMDGPRPELRAPHMARVLADIAAGPANVDVICIGTSRFGMGIFPSDIQLHAATGDRTATVFNEAVPSQDFDAADFMLDKMVGRGWRPALAVIELCPEMVNRRNCLLGAYVLPCLSSETSGTYLSDVLLSRNLGRLVVERLIPIYRFRRALRAEVVRLISANSHETATPAAVPPTKAPTSIQSSTAQKPRPSAEELFLNGDPSVTQRQLAEEKLPMLRRWLADYRIGGTSSLALERLIRHCRDQGMEVLLVAPPVASCQRDLYTPEIESVFVPYIHRLEKTYKCRFVDYRDSLPDEEFYDNHHLRPSGGRLFSRQLTREVLIPAWHRLHPEQTARVTTP